MYACFPDLYVKGRNHEHTKLTIPGQNSSYSSFESYKAELHKRCPKRYYFSKRNTPEHYTCSVAENFMPIHNFPIVVSPRTIMFLISEVRTNGFGFIHACMHRYSDAYKSIMLAWACTVCCAALQRNLRSSGIARVLLGFQILF